MDTALKHHVCVRHGQLGSGHTEKITARENDEFGHISKSFLVDLQ
jgi:hypothetical protein